MHRQDKVATFNPPFWGIPDVSMDWCEDNYAVTQYIAEFYNTLSAVPIFIWALLGMILCWKSGVKEKRFLVVNACLLLNGLGSAIFHGTLRYYAQVFLPFNLSLSLSPARKK